MAYPTYKNTSGATKYFEQQAVANNGTIECTDGKYRYPIPSGFVLLSHGDSPTTKLHASTIGAGITLTGLSAYQKIEIQNDSGETITLTFNEDSTNTYAMLDGQDKTFVQNDRGGLRDFDKLVISGSGSDNVYVDGWQVG